MTNFNTQIESPSGTPYLLEVHTLNKGLNDPGIVQVFIAISKKVRRKQRLATTVAIRFTLATHRYQAIEKIQGITSVLYERIIDLLERTFGKQWGFITNTTNRTSIS